MDIPGIEVFRRGWKQTSIEVDNVEVLGEYRLIEDCGILLVEIFMHAPYECHWYVRNCEPHFRGPNMMNMSCPPFRARLSLELTYRKKKAFDEHYRGTLPVRSPIGYPEI